MIEDTLTQAEESIEALGERFPGVTTGRVIRVDDPLFLGRVQVQLPFIDALDTSPWARVAVPMAGLTHGHYFLPNIGDEVLVAFEHGDIHAPYVLGSLWTALARPPLASPLPQVRAIRTLVGNQIVFEETPPAITLQTAPTAPEVLPTPASPVGPHQTVRLAPEGISAQGTMIELKSGNNTVLVSPAGISITTSASSVNITDAGVEIRAPTVSINSAGTVDIRGAMVKINS